MTGMCMHVYLSPSPPALGLVYLTNVVTSIFQPGRAKKLGQTPTLSQKWEKAHGKAGMISWRIMGSWLVYIVVKEGERFGVSEW